MINLKNKKAEMTTEEIVKIILAVIGIGLLLYLSVSLYGIFTSKTKLEQATKNLESIVSIVNTLDEGETRNFIIEGPKDWSIYLFTEGMEIPISNKCEGKDCICFCDGGCGDSDGICKPVNFITTFWVEDGLKLDVIPQEISISRGNKSVLITEIK